MPVQSVRMRRGDSFEETVFDQVSRALGNYREPYTIASPFKLNGRREYDGLIISPYAVFTLEMKNIGGTIRKGPNTPLTIFDEKGQEVDLSNRHEDPLAQADMQWRDLSDYFKESFGTESLFVKAVLVFPDGSRFHVPPENRDFSDHRVNVLFATVSEVAKLVQQFRPPFPVSLSSQVQAIIAKAIREGAYTLTAQEKQQVANVTPAKRPSPPPPQKSRPSQPLRSSYQVANERLNQRPARQTPEAETPIAFPPSDRQSKPKREGPSWFILFLGFGASYLLFSFVTSTTASLIGAAIFTFFMWRKRRTIALLSIIAFFLLIMVFNSLDYSAILDDFIEMVPTLTENSSQEQSVEEIEDSGQFKEGDEESDETAVPNTTPRLRVIGNSNVRAQPSLEGDVVGLAEANTVFVILAETADKSWYKIRLSNGTEGWIGSTRITLLNP